MNITEAKARTALSPSRLPGIDWALNPYRGCQHGCLYCYSADMLRMSPAEKWGHVVEVRKNIPVLIAKERKRREGVIGLGTVTDPYQPAEGTYRVTRYCLEQLALGDNSVCIQTKSDLIVRDIDILSRMKDPEAGITVTTMDYALAAILEPGAPAPERRIAAVGKLASTGIHNWIFLGPIIPGMNDSYESMGQVVRAARAAGAGKILFDHFRAKPLIRERLVKGLGYEMAHVIIRDSADREWQDRVSIDVEILGEDNGIGVERAVL